MKLYSETGDFKLYQGSMLEMLGVIAPNSIDAVVTDPPYELGFMGKGWDNSGIAFQPDTWRKCYAVLKSGGYLLAFGGTRTFHRIACAIEDAGFEIRDTIMWLYGSGFPKSMNIGLAIDKKNGVESPVVGVGKSGAPDTHTKTLHSVSEITGTGWFGGEYEIRQAQNKWSGWGTALKPAYEPVIVARKPCEGSCLDNVIQYGVGGININACRIPTDEKLSISTSTTEKYGRNAFYSSKTMNNPERTQDPNGRYPSNVILTYDDTDFQEVCGGMPTGGANGTVSKAYDYKADVFGDYKKKEPFDSYGDSGSAARYYYCAKASKRDRDEGLEAFETKQCTGGGGGIGDYLSDVNSCSGKYGSEKAPHKNTHPTVKPTDLMQYLIRLVTPPSGTVLDPFNGSGSTGKAVMYENRDRNASYKYIGIELTAEYLPIADARIRYAAGDHSPVTPAEQPLTGQITFFDLLGGENDLPV